MVYDTSSSLVPVYDNNVSEEAKVLCIIKDETSVDWKWDPQTITVNLSSTSLVSELVTYVSKEANYTEESFLLVWVKSHQHESPQDEVVLNEVGEKTLSELGLSVQGRNRFMIKQKDGIQPVKLKEGPEPFDSSVGNLFQESNAASASSYTGSYYSGDMSLYGKSKTGFVGLVNQAMTCYLNSLMQSLYMTPEFRNAIYRWEATGSEEKDIKCIPSQLQKLFLQLQTSTKKAVETTDLTKSFGWDSSEAWHQHDVQELCRVMFDALESKFKNTDQADFINKLYQGKMKDYVKCLECGNESARTDTYLDIPLAIRPFGENKAFGSVEESLHAFVTPETLSDTNQYFCEKCNKKCDAHKGLKFLSFPYLLTLQMKRFAFDYNTLHRIKLNDRMTFPQFLNLAGFIDEEETSTDDDQSIKGDSPSSTETDSGVSEGYSDNGILTEDEDQTVPDNLGNGPVNGPNAYHQTDDQEDEGALQSEPAPHDSDSPHIYELFSIMIHSGSASGGHYYAYIKSLSDGEWYCFNDQSVSVIGSSEIERSFGGSEYSRGYYSSIYSSSTNAYMLMYRQVNKERNSKFLEFNELPAHIVRLLQSIKVSEEMERKRKEDEKNTCKIKVFYNHPVLKKICERRLEIHKDKTLRNAVEISMKLLAVESKYTVDQCRLVKYDEYYDTIEKSYEEQDDTPIGDVLGGVKSSYTFELLLETRQSHETFDVYRTGGTTLRIHRVDLDEGKVYCPVNVRIYLEDTINELKKHVAEKLGMPAEQMRIVMESQNDLKLLQNPNRQLRDLGYFKSAKMFVESSGSEDKVLFTDSRLFKILDSYQHTITLLVSLPDTETKPNFDDQSENIYDNPKESETSADFTEKEIKIDKRTTLAKLKEKLATLVDCSVDFFRVYRVYSNNQEIELVRHQDKLTNFVDDTKISVKYGRALKKDEYHIKVYLLKPNDTEEPFCYLFDWVVYKGLTVGKCKELLLPELKKRFDTQCPVQNLRLRKKTWKNPGTVYMDDQVFDDNIAVYANFEVFVEELQGPERITSNKIISLYVCHWHPSTLTVGPLQEVVLVHNTPEELKEEISQLTCIPLENVEFAKGRSPFPCTVSLLEIHDQLDWNPNTTSLRNSPLFITDDGAVIYCRDKTEELMELSEEKKQEIMKTENTKTSAPPSKPTSFSYKEKALKIYKDGEKPST